MSRLIMNNVAAPSAPASGKTLIYVNSTDGMIKTLDSTSTSTNLNNVTVASTVASSGSIANTDTKIGAGLLVTANTLTAGSLIRYSILGTSTTSAAGSQVFTIRFGSANTTSDTAQATYTLAAATSGTAIPFKIIIDVTIRTIGSAGTIYGYGSLINGDAATTGIYTKASNITLLGSIATINTTSTGYFNVSYVSGNASTACTFQQVVTELIRQ